MGEIKFIDLILNTQDLHLSHYITQQQHNYTSYNTSYKNDIK